MIAARCSRRKSSSRALSKRVFSLRPVTKSPTTTPRRATPPTASGKFSPKTLFWASGGAGVAKATAGGESMAIRMTNDFVMCLRRHPGHNYYSGAASARKYDPEAAQGASCVRPAHGCRGRLRRSSCPARAQSRALWLGKVFPETRRNANDPVYIGTLAGSIMPGVATAHPLVCAVSASRCGRPRRWLGNADDFLWRVASERKSPGWRTSCKTLPVTMMLIIRTSRCRDRSTGN